MLTNIECMIKEYLGPTVEYMLYFKQFFVMCRLKAERAFKRGVLSKCWNEVPVWQ